MTISSEKTQRRVRPDPDSDLSAIVPVILAGGTGKRLWPLSTVAKPKPFIKSGGLSFLQKTAERVNVMRSPFVVCHARHRPLVMDQIKTEQIVLEPVGRGTAPAVASVAHFLAQREDPLMLVLPSDHAIADTSAFLQAVQKGISAARAGAIVTFGIEPRSASSHYGYIKAGAGAEGVYEVKSFAEKPDRATARGFLEEGGYSWNSGIFLFSAKTYLENLQMQQPAIFEASYSALAKASRLQNSIFLDEKIFSACPALSIDYAVMEKAPKAAVIPVSMGWRDLGTWPALLAAMLKK